MYIIKVLLFLCLVLNSNEISTPEDDHYVAAVVEYNVDRDVAANKEKYAELTRQAAQQNADIVVFPELTLTNNSVAFAVPIHSLLREYPIPALQPTLYDELFVAMSAAARDNNIYLVINVRELMDCTTETGETCPEAKQYIFNTNVVFDRTGAVIDRYRKINLFGEYSHTAAFQPDLGVFTTDFGVTFGHFICFDLMFQVPAVQVVQKNNIRNVIFPTMWFSELPYLTAVEIQQAYAYAMDVNFLGAGANRVAAGSAGSGIYSGKAGALISTMPGVDVTRLLVATVPKVPGQVTWPVPGPIYDNASDHDGLRLIVDPSLASHVSRLLEDGAQEFSLTDGDVTCTFKVRMRQREGESGVWYRAFVQDGSNTYARREVGVAACSVVACKTADIKTCGYKFNETEKRLIQELEIQMRTISNSYNRTLKCDNTKYFPLSLNTNKLPLNNKNFTFTITSSIKTDQCKEEEENTIFQNYLIDGKRETISFKINMPQDELVGFGVWGRIFNRDVDHNKEITDEDRRKFNTLWDNIYGV